MDNTNCEKPADETPATESESVSTAEPTTTEEAAPATGEAEQQPTDTAHTEQAAG